MFKIFRKISFVSYKLIIGIVVLVLVSIGILLYWRDSFLVEQAATKDPTISRDTDGKVWINATYYGTAASPYIYILKNDKYEFLSDFIGEADSKDKEYFSFTDITQTQIIDGKVKLKITEELDETVYINRVYLRVDGNQTVDLSSISTGLNYLDLSLLSDSDGKYLEMKKGDEYFFEFPVPENYSKLEFTAQGYFIKEEKKPDFVKGEDTNASWVKKFVYDHPEYQTMPVVKREQNSIHFKKPDGKIEAQFSDSPIHFKNDNGQWQVIDTRVVPSIDANYNYMNITNNYKSYFSFDPQNDKVKLEKNGSSISFSVLNPHSLIGKITSEDSGKQEVINFASIENNGKTLDINYKIFDTKVKEEIILKEYQELPEINQEIKLENAYAREEGKALRIYKKSTNELLWYLPEPSMYEQNNSENSNSGLHYELKCKDSNLTIEKCSNLILTKVLDAEGKAWLTTATYPVIVDPDYVGSTSDWAVSADWVDSWASARTTSNTRWAVDLTELYVTSMASGAKWWNRRSFIKFNTATIPDGATINTVNLNMTVSRDATTSDFDIQIKKCDWSGTDPGTDVNMETAYDNALSSANDVVWRNTNGVVPNTSYTSPNMATDWVSLTGETYYALITGLDRDNSAPPGNASSFYLYSSDAVTSSYRPMLTVNYTAESSTPTPTPTPTPTSTPTSTSTSSVTNSVSSSNSSGASCIASEITAVVPVIIDSKRVDADSIFISWGPYSGTNTFNIEYGTENGKWLYNTDVTGFSTTINALPTNQPIWVRVAARNNCTIGSYGEAKLVGGPGLPSTGTGPKNYVSCYITAGIFAGILVLLVLIKKKHRRYLK